MSLSAGGLLDASMENLALVLEEKERVLIRITIMDTIANRLKVFMENEARSCSMDFGCITT